MGAVAIGKAILGFFLNPRVLLVLALLGAGWYAFNFVHEMGERAEAARLQPKIDQLTTSLATATATIAAHTATIANMEQAHQRALALQRDQSAAVIADLTLKLDKSDKTVRKLKEQIDAKARHFVPPAADAACSVNAGFVRLHNRALAGDLDQPAPGEAAAMAAGGRTDDAAPTGVALSVVGAVTADNYAECNARGEVIRAWQSWYTKNKAIWEAAVQEQQNFLKVTPLLAPPVSNP